ncbi:MAG: hypothetical protein ACK559_03580, partial [bacterium]
MTPGLPELQFIFRQVHGGQLRVVPGEQGLVRRTGENEGPLRARRRPVGDFDLDHPGGQRGMGFR